MTACQSAPAAKKMAPAKPVRKDKSLAMPDKRLWETDKTQAFEAGIRWFLAVSRAA